MKNFTSKQKEIVARKLGYDGPMQGFDDFVKSSPALEARFSAVTQKYVEKMAKGGVVKKMATGGSVTGGGDVTYSDVGGTPQAADAAVLKATTMDAPTADQLVGTGSIAPATAAVATPSTVTSTQQVAAPTQVGASTFNAATSTPAMQTAMDGVDAAQGDVSQDAQVVAAQQDPTTTDVGTVQAAQLDQAQTVQGVPTRTAQADEMVSGTGVDMTAANKLADQTASTAAQGTVTDQMTVQGQLSTLTANFDASNPPSWAAGAVRAANAMLASRGLSASSMAGQAVVQAAMESALPIASADAQAFQQMASQNLSNRQQSAVLAAQQRAQFMGQNFDQAFQTKVLNAAKVADIANTNFNAQQQVALENARMAQTVDLNNLSNNQAVVMANAAQIASLEAANLNARQQAAVVNAQSFLQMDMANLGNEQQAVMFKSQQISQSILSDTAAVNASKQFNATSQNQTDQFMSTMVSQVSQFNAAQTNAVNQFNSDQVNALSKFNAEQQNARSKFNSEQRLVIDQSNAQWRREISTADTAAINASNYLNAQNIQGLTVAEYNNQSQFYRDQIQHAFDSYENDNDRMIQMAVANIAAKSETTSAQTSAEGDMWSALGIWAASL